MTETLSGSLTLIAALVAAVCVVMALASPGSVADARQPQAPDHSLTVMSYNIRTGIVSDGRLDPGRTADEIRASGAEVVALQEVDNHWRSRSTFEDQARLLAERLGMHYVYAANLDLESAQQGQPRRQYGTAILSKYPILESQSTLLPRPQGGEQRGLLEALMNVHGVPVRVYNTHLQHNNQVGRTVQVAAIMEHIGESEEPTILVGDLNARPDAPEIQPLYTNFDDAWVDGGEGPGYTIPAKAPYSRIDYILVPPEIQVQDARVLDTLASDHLPLVSTVILPGEEVGLGR